MSKPITECNHYPKITLCLDCQRLNMIADCDTRIKELGEQLIVAEELNDDQAHRLGEQEAENKALRDGLGTSLSWAKNWDSPFLEDEDWVSVDGPKLYALLKQEQE